MGGDSSSSRPSLPGSGLKTALPQVWDQQGGGLVARGIASLPWLANTCLGSRHCLGAPLATHLLSPPGGVTLAGSPNPSPSDPGDTPPRGSPMGSRFHASWRSHSSPPSHLASGLVAALSSCRQPPLHSEHIQRSAQPRS